LHWPKAPAPKLSTFIIAPKRQIGTQTIKIATHANQSAILFGSAGSRLCPEWQQG
jgi:hypothetical protein